MTKLTNIPRWEHKENAGTSKIVIILTNNKTTRLNKKRSPNASYGEF